MIYKKTNKLNSNGYTTFYLGLTDDKTPLLLNEAVEFIHRFDRKHNKQSFYYYYIDNDDDLKISFSLYSGHINAEVRINKIAYTGANIVDDSFLFTIPRFKILQMCLNKVKCQIEIVVSNDNDYLSYSSFLIAVRSTKDIPIYLKQGTVNKRSILSGEDQHFIVDLQPDIAFGAKIIVYFSKGQGEIYVRKALSSELFNITDFPDENNYEYMSTYKTSKKNFYLIEIPYGDFLHASLCKVLLTVRGVFPGYYTSTTIEYSISVSNIMNQLTTDKNYRLFISQGEIQQYHFKLKDNKKRLYISMTNKDEDANMYLNYETYSSSISEYKWENIGGYNEFIDISVDDPYFVERQMEYIDGDYYLAIQGLNDCFFNLYVSTQDVKIITLEKNSPAGCSCESKNDFCYFRYENINDPDIKKVYEQDIIFYTEYTYGSGTIFGKIFPSGNMEEIMKALPTVTNNDYMGDESDEFLFVHLNVNNPKYTYSSVLVVGVQCKVNSLFDLSAALLNQQADLSRNDKNYMMLKLNQDNFYYISRDTGKSYKFVYYKSSEDVLNFNIKAVTGQAQVHVYTNETLANIKFSGYEVTSTISNKNYHHISDFMIDSSIEEKKDYYGLVPQTLGKGFYFFMDVKAIEDCLVNINIHYNTDIIFLPINKEIATNIRKDDFYAYFDLSKDIEEYILSATSSENNLEYNVYIKINIIKPGQNSQINDEQKQYSKPSSTNYDIKGKTNALTSSVSLRIKNVAKSVRKDSIVRVLVNIECSKYYHKDKLKIMVSPVVNKINRIRPQQHTYYFTEIQKQYSHKTLFMLNNLNSDDDLMIMEISICKGEFQHILLDSPPSDTETYSQLKKRSLDTLLFGSNGKTLMVRKNIEVKEYYLLVYGADNSRNMGLLLNDDIEKTRIEISSDVDLLFSYYTTNSKKYNYLVSQDYVHFESYYDFYSIKFILPELKRRDIFGKEKYVDNINYTLIVSEKKVDYDYMESTCYLTKLMQKQQENNNPYSYLKSNYDKEKNIFKVEGFLGDKTYYINLIAKNFRTGEIITYRPIMIKTSELERKGRNFVIVFLSIILTVFFCIAFTTYRHYKIQKSKISSFQIDKTPSSSLKSKIQSLKNINLSFKTKEYNSLSEDSKELNG